MIKEFEYFEPKTVEEALDLLSHYGEAAKVLAGGQSLLVMMKQNLVAPDYIVDIHGIPGLDYLHFDENEGLKIGCLTVHRVIEKSAVIRERFSVLSEMESKVSTIQTRNWGTLAGNLCHADPAGDPAPVLIALQGKVSIANSQGTRTVNVEDFFTDYFETVLAQDEIVTEIEIPNPSPRTGSAYAKFNKRQGDMAVVGTAVCLTLDAKNGACTDARIVLSAVTRVPHRVKKSEELLKGKIITEKLLDEAAQVAFEEILPIGDHQASQWYRRELVRVLVKRVAKEALEKAKRM
jgi:aerobic carbon-monoxide dehydrogenase medium subunit